MSEAAHPQRDDAAPADAQGPDQLVEVKNPFPSAMTVPGVDGQDVVVELSSVDGVVYAPRLDDLVLAPQVRQYVTQYCAAWSSSVLTTGKLQNASVSPPRRAQVVFHEAELHAMLGLAADESLIAVVVDPVTSTVRFVVESPRLPRKQEWNVEPPYIRLPVAAFYEGAAQVAQ